MPLVNGIIYFLNLALLSSLWYLLLKLVVYVSKKPLWVEHMPSLNRVNPKVFASHTLLVLRQIKFQHCNLFEDEKWMKGCALKKWESTLNFMFMPMDLMWNLSWKLLAKYLIIWAILPVSLNWIPCSYGSDHIVLLWSHFSGKFKHLSSADQYPTPTSTLICRWVLPPWYLDNIT